MMNRHLLTELEKKAGKKEEKKAGKRAKKRAEPKMYPIEWTR